MSKPVKVYRYTCQWAQGFELRVWALQFGVGAKSGVLGSQGLELRVWSLE